MPPTIINALELQGLSRILSVESVLATGFQLVVLVSHADGLRSVIKWSEDHTRTAAELRGLRELSAVVRIPKLYAEGVCEQQFSYFCMEYIEEVARPQWHSLGQSLATLHRFGAEAFGFKENNFIGGSPQCNVQREDQPAVAGVSWGEFFFEYRLRPQLELASGWLAQRESELLMQRRPRIIETLGESRPLLLHGDLWSGNILWTDTAPVFIDPAVYYGSPEADIAFLELFGSPSPDFYQTYQRQIESRPGYPQRKRILNLYHLLNHATLFGGGYQRQSVETLTAIARDLGR